MPFGLTNAPATFRRLMESCLSDLHLNWCIIYLDDVIVFSKTPEEHIARLEAVFKKISNAGLRLKPSKCEFFKKCIHYLGHIVSCKGLKTGPKKIEAIVNWPGQRTVNEVRKFLGFTNYYRKFVYKYAQIARPFISGENAKKKHRKVEWGNEQEQAFQKLKEACTKTPVLTPMRTIRNHFDSILMQVNLVWDQYCINNRRIVLFVSLHMLVDLCPKREKL